jgi:hypothetical protein
VICGWVVGGGWANMTGNIELEFFKKKIIFANGEVSSEMKFYNVFFRKKKKKNFTFLEEDVDAGLLDGVGDEDAPVESNNLVVKTTRHNREHRRSRVFFSFFFRGKKKKKM